MPVHEGDLHRDRGWVAGQRTLVIRGWQYGEKLVPNPNARCKHGEPIYLFRIKRDMAISPSPNARSMRRMKISLELLLRMYGNAQKTHANRTTIHLDICFKLSSVSCQMRWQARMKGRMAFRLDPAQSRRRRWGKREHDVRLPFDQQRAPIDTQYVRSTVDRVPGIRHACDIDLLLFFYRHPRAMLTSEQLVAYLGYGRERIAKSLDALVGTAC